MGGRGRGVGRAARGGVRAAAAERAGGAGRRRARLDRSPIDPRYSTTHVRRRGGFECLGRCRLERPAAALRTPRPSTPPSAPIARLHGSHDRAYGPAPIGRGRWAPKKNRARRRLSGSARRTPQPPLPAPARRGRRRGAPAVVTRLTLEAPPMARCAAEGAGAHAPGCAPATARPRPLPSLSPAYFRPSDAALPTPRNRAPAAAPPASCWQRRPSRPNARRSQPPPPPPASPPSSASTSRLKARRLGCVARPTGSRARRRRAPACRSPCATSRGRRCGAWPGP